MDTVNLPQRGSRLNQDRSRVKMSWNLNHGLPFLPGYTFRDVTKSAFHRPQTLGYKNGYCLRRRPSVGVGQDPLLSEQLLQDQISDVSFEAPDLTYGPFDQREHEEFVPAHVALDKKVLRYYAYFVEDILYSPEEAYRVRPVIIYYFLENDTMCIMEPVVENSGMLQGKRIKRQRLPKNQRGEHYQWKDLNLGMDLEVYGVKYRITQCDAFTKEFMASEGIVLNDPEPVPEDPYSNRRHNPEPSYTTPSTFDQLHQFLTMDGKVLRFFALWDDADSLVSETRYVTIQYYLVDDTVEIREVHERNNGRDALPVLLHRQRPAKRFKAGTFSSCVTEVSKDDVDEYFSPKDFQLGRTITLLGRRFLLYDCDGFTKEYYEKNHPEMEMKGTQVPKKAHVLQDRKNGPCFVHWRPVILEQKGAIPKLLVDGVEEISPVDMEEVPPYNGFGSLEDSLQNCLHLIPQPPKKNVLKMLENDHKVLRYSARLDSQNPEDECRRFVLSYFLSNDMISVFEKSTRNSGIIGGKFLEKTRVPKPGSTVEDPEFYSPADFAIGATVEVFGRRFVLTDADHYVLTYLESISGVVPCQTLDSLRQKLGVGMSDNRPAEQSGDATEPLS